MVRRLILHEGIGGVEDGSIGIHEQLTVQLVGAGLGQDLNPAVTRTVILGGEGILVDDDGADRRLGRQLSAGKAVDVDLAPAGTRSGTRQRGEFVRQFVRVVGKGVEVLARQHHGAHVVVWIHAYAWGIAGNLYLLLLHLNRKRNIQVLGLPGGNPHRRRSERGESGGLHGDRVLAGRQAGNCILATSVRRAYAARPGSRCHGERGLGNDGSAGIGHLAP